MLIYFTETLSASAARQGYNFIMIGSPTTANKVISQSHSLFTKVKHPFLEKVKIVIH